MIYDLQKASILKRISAALLDLILLVIVIVGIASLVSTAVGYDSYSAQLEEYYASYEKEFGVVFDITEETYNAMSVAERENYDAAYAALIADEDAMYVYNMTISLSLVVLSLGILGGYLVTEFAVPLLIGNGQTVGKRVFSLAVVRSNCVRIRPVSLFIRTLLGKYTLETMIPVLVAFMVVYNMAGLVPILLVLVLAVAQVVLLFANRNHCLIHDLIADAVVVDMSSQMIFESEENLLDYKKRVAAERAEQSPYF